MKRSHRRAQQKTTYADNAKTENPLTKPASLLIRTINQKNIKMAVTSKNILSATSQFNAGKSGNANIPPSSEITGSFKSILKISAILYKNFSIKNLVDSTLAEARLKEKFFKKLTKTYCGFHVPINCLCPTAE